MYKLIAILTITVLLTIKDKYVWSYLQNRRYLKSCHMDNFRSSTGFHPRVSNLLRESRIHLLAVWICFLVLDAERRQIFCELRKNKKVKSV